MNSLESVIALLLTVVATTSLSTLAFALGAGAWAFRSPTQYSAWVAFAAALPACVVGILFAAVRLALHEEEGDRILFPLTVVAALIQLWAASGSLWMSHRAARRSGIRSPLAQPLGVGLMLMTLAGALTFVWVSWD